MPTCFPTPRLLISSSSPCGLGSRCSFSTRSDKIHIFSEIYLYSTTPLAYRKAASRGSQFKIKLRNGVGTCEDSKKKLSTKLKIVFSSSKYTRCNKTSFNAESLSLQKPIFCCKTYSEPLFLYNLLSPFKFKAYYLSPWGFAMLYWRAQRIWKCIPENSDALFHAWTDTRTLSVWATKAVASPTPASVTGR